MSDKPKKEDKPADAKADGHGDGAKKKGGLLTKLPVLLGGVMVIEAAVLFVGFKMIAGGPAAASAVELSAEGGHETPEAGHGEAAEGGHDDAGHGEAAPSGGHGEAASGDHGKSDAKAAPKDPPVDPKKLVEVAVVDFRAPNKVSGRTFLYDVSIYAITKGANKKKIEDAIKDRGALIKDRVRTIIAQSDPEKLGGGSEPGLETLRRQVKVQLDQIIGEGVIDEVVVPRCTPFRTDF